MTADVYIVSMFIEHFRLGKYTNHTYSLKQQYCRFLISILELIEGRFARSGLSQTLYTHQS